MNDSEPFLPTEETGPAPHRADVSTLTDPELVLAVGRGSHAALAEIYGRHGGPSHSLAARLGGTKADDIVQDVFLRLWQRPERFEDSRGSLRSFLMMQIRSRAVDLLRSDGSRRTRGTATWVEHTGSGAETVRWLGWPVSGRGRCWHASTRARGTPSRSPGGHTYREVAVLLTLPEGTVKSRIRQGLTKLRQSIELDTIDHISHAGRGES